MGFFCSSYHYLIRSGTYRELIEKQLPNYVKRCHFWVQKEHEKSM